GRSSFRAAALLGGVAPREGSSADFTLVPFPRAFVRPMQGGKPFPADLFIRTFVDGQGEYDTETDEVGWAEVAPELGGLRRGRVRVSFFVDGFQEAQVRVDLSSDRDVRTPVELRPLA